MKFQALFQKTKKLLVTSALALVAFFAGDCPKTPQPQLAVSKVTINGTNLNLEDANAVQENVPLQLTVVVTFDKAVTLDDVQAKVKIAKQADNQNVAIEIAKTSDGVFTISLLAGASLTLNTDYLITIEKDLSATVDGTTYTLSQTLSLKFKTTVTPNTYTVTFDSKEGSSVDFQTIDKDKKANEPAAPTRDGYKFDGWYKEEALTSKFVFADEVITSNITLYAKWLNQSTTLSLEVNGSAVTFTDFAATINVTYGSAIPSSLSYTNLVVASGATAKDANASGEIPALTSAGSLQATNDTLRILVTAEDATSTKTYTMTINVAEKPTVTFYAGADTLGQAIKDTSLMNFEVAIVSNVADKTYMITLGNVELRKTASNGRFTVMKNELLMTDAADNALFTIKYGDASELTLARYKPKNIHAWQDLQAMRMDLTGNYELMKNIVFPELGEKQFPETGFEPIGKDIVKTTDAYQGNPFSGTLDGNSKRIKNFAVNDEELSFVGLFGKVNAAEASAEVLKNVVFEDPNILCQAIAGVGAGWLENGKFVNVVIELSEGSRGDTVKTTGVQKRLTTDPLPYSFVGGLVGYVGSGGFLSMCNSHISVKGISWLLGGLAGYCNGGKITGYAMGNVHGNDRVGGLVGENSGSVTGYAAGNVRGNNNVGGLVGVNTATVTGYALGNVHGNGDFVSGLVSYSNGGTITGYAAGNVDGNGDYVSGLVSYSNGGTIIGYAAGRVRGSRNHVGGLVGLNDGATIEGFWDQVSSQQATSSGGVNVVKITSIANVEWNANTDRYEDTGNSNTIVFNQTKFAEKFTITQQNPGNGKWPKLKETEFSFSQPNLPSE